MNPTRESRPYIHDRCNQVTEVSGAAFSNLASPLAGLERTYCNACKGMFGVDEFRWADSGEPLPDYYQRHGQRATVIERFIASSQAIICGLIVSLILGTLAAMFFYIGQGDDLVTAMACGVGVAVLSMVAIAALLISLLTPWAHRRACGVSDPRQLI